MNDINILYPVKHNTVRLSWLVSMDLIYWLEQQTGIPKVVGSILNILQTVKDFPINILCNIFKNKTSMPK